MTISDRIVSHGRQLLSEMDGFSGRAAVIVMAATNRRDVLDPALTRPGRFDRIIYVGKPDFDGRIEILKARLTPAAGFCLQVLQLECLHVPEAWLLFS